MGVNASDTRTRRFPQGTGADLTTVASVLLLLGLAVGIGIYVNRSFPNVNVWAGAPPLFGHRMPHGGPGSAAAVLVALVVITWGPVLISRLRWRVALALAYVGAVCWTFALAMVDGWRLGIKDSLLEPASYLSEVPGITDISTMLNEFSDRILLGQPDSWTVHVAGHPPGATLVFVWLDRLGLSGAVPAAFACILVGCLVAVAVPATVAILGAKEQARTIVPFAVLFPGAVWIGVSADGLFAGVTACGIAMLAWAGVALRNGRRGGVAAALGAGVLLGFGIFLSYGLILLGVLVLAVLGLACARSSAWRLLLLAIGGALAVVAVFALAGFWWFDGYQLVVERYYQGVAAKRPYWYWAWANLAALALVLGPALIAGARRVVVRVGSDRPWLRGRQWEVVAALSLAALAVIAVADVSGLSKAEVERIWLPFAVWLIPAAALLPDRSHRWWLAGQAATALAVNHLVLTLW